jgi:hypothetical protein
MSEQTSKTIKGTLVLLPNPCTSKPCLPGMAFAVNADSVSYFLVRNDRFYMQGSSEMNKLPNPGETVVASGVVQEKHDVAGKPFTTIEASSLRRD